MCEILDYEDVGSFRLYKRDIFDDLIRSIKGKTYVFQMEVPLCFSIYSTVFLILSFVDYIESDSKALQN
jgi:hypothetical protein